MQYEKKDKETRMTGKQRQNNRRAEVYVYLYI